MRAGLDATPLSVCCGGGLRRYVAELSRALALEFPADAFFLASDQQFAAPENAPANLSSLPLPRNPLERRWWLWGLDRALDSERADVFHGTNFEVPYRASRPSILTLHDLSPWRDEDSGRPEARRVRSRTPLLVRLGIATMVLTPTDAVRREAMDLFGVHPARIATVHEAAAAVFQPRSVTAPVPYFLYTGDTGHRKNTTIVLDAWREVRKRHAVDLVFAGLCSGITAEPGVRLAGFVTDEELVGLYSGALALLYPSLYEGFGLPVLEAMQCGAPVIASRIPALQEVAGDAGVLLDPRDVRSWAGAMSQLVERSEFRCELSSLGVRRSRSFSWTAAARATRELYEEARRRFDA